MSLGYVNLNQRRLDRSFVVKVNLVDIHLVRAVVLGKAVAHLCDFAANVALCQRGQEGCSHLVLVSTGGDAGESEVGGSREVEVVSVVEAEDALICAKLAGACLRAVEHLGGYGRCERLALHLGQALVLRGLLCADRCSREEQREQA